MWSVESSGVHLDLTGTIHGLPEGGVELPDPLVRAVDDADYLMLELDVRDLLESGGEEVIPFLLSEGYYIDGGSLDDHLPSKLMKRVRVLATDHGLPSDVLGVMRPWLAAMTLDSLVGATRGYEAERGLDMVLAEMFGSEDIIALETAEYQLGQMASLSLGDQVAFLEQVVAANEIDMVPLYIDAWNRGDPTMLEDAFGVDGTAMSGGMYKAMIVERNIRMAGILDDVLENGEGRYLVAVGAAHFVGRLGLPEMLRRRGYRVDQLDSDGRRLLMVDETGVSQDSRSGLE